MSENLTHFAIQRYGKKTISLYILGDYWLSKRQSMKRPTAKYSRGEIGEVRIIEDFLPSPDKLVLREDNVKVTLSLSQRSVTFFKRAAQKRRVPYQRMIRALVDAYAEKQGGKG